MPRCVLSFGTILDWGVWKRLVLFLCEDVLELFQRLLHISWHVQVDSTIVIVPGEVDADVLLSRPIGFTFVVLFDD